MTSKDMVAKLPKTDVNYDNYGAYPDGAHCCKCSNYKGHGVCKIVRGLISPDGWCRRFSYLDNV